MEEGPTRDDKMWSALKRHIMRERERKKQELAAEVEEERLRKEREARVQQDVMTLGETKEQIIQLEQQVVQLREEKHQLFVELKKVLNLDQIMKNKQFPREEFLGLQGIPQGMIPPQIYAPPPNIAQPRTVVNVPPSAGYKSIVKRPRSPSPPPTSISVAYSQPQPYFKPISAMPTYQSPQKEDTRRHDIRVLWNKAPGYANQSNAYYPPQDIQIYYPPGALPSRDPPRSVYETTRQVAPASYHIEAKPTIDHYSSMRPSVASHVIHSTLPLTPAQPKAGSITAGFPVRQQTQYQPPPSAPVGALYTNQSRTVYQTASGGTINYPRD